MEVGRRKMKKVNESEQVSGVQWCRAVRAAGVTGIATLRGAGAKSAQMAITDAKRTSKRSACVSHHKKSD